MHLVPVKLFSQMSMLSSGTETSKSLLPSVSARKTGKKWSIEYSGWKITSTNSNTHLSSPYLQSCVTCMFDGNNFTVIPLFIICLVWFSVHYVSLTHPHPQIVSEHDTLLHNLSLKMTQEYMESSARGCLPLIVFLTITACQFISTFILNNPPVMELNNLSD